MPERKIPKEVDGYIGFANLPNQVFRKAVKKGFEFTLMVVDLKDVTSNVHYENFRCRKLAGLGTDGKPRLLNNLTVVDTPGFGDAVDNSDCWQPVINYIEN
ncbi:protein peanut-like, partial [Diaphorina citri]|uniref:Protein peanut-like n=1 Tax=Diaphorina citri TaxID=121845 RepID=A0A1S3DAI2_DIACI